MFVPVKKACGARKGALLHTRRPLRRLAARACQAPVKNITSRGSGTRCCPRVDHQRRSGDAGCIREIQRGGDDILGPRRTAQRRHTVSGLEPVLGLVARLHRQAGREPDHPDLRRERLGERDRRGLQRRLRQRVRQIVRVHVVQLLIQHIDDHAALAFVAQRSIGRRVVKHARKHQRRAEVHRGQLQQQLVADVARRVFLEARRVVDDARRPP
ncbi:hypothetical protein QFZ94_006304 [Paraburkholderia sp. JPY465]